MKREDVVKTINNLKGEEGHQKVLEVYNSQKPLPRGYNVKNTDAWCATTVSAVFLMNGYSDISECSCPQMIEKAKAKGIWVEDDAYTPKLGDIIMYDWQDSGKGDNVGVADHVGIVVSVTKNKIMVREGNKNKSIGNRDVTVNGIFIRGYITPPYEDDKKTAQKASESKKETKESESSSVSKKAENKPQSEVKVPYTVGKVYTIQCRSCLNVRKTPNGALVGYANLTADGKRHAYSNGALKTGTRVSCLEVKVINSTFIWMRIPSGWICCVDGAKKYVV